MKFSTAIALGLSLIVGLATAAPRSGPAKASFQRRAPCPSTGHHRGACPGYVIDHVQPLCAGGADAPSNLQWQTIADAKAKDVLERRECIALRREKKMTP